MRRRFVGWAGYRSRSKTKGQVFRPLALLLALGLVLVACGEVEDDDGGLTDPDAGADADATDDESDDAADDDAADDDAGSDTGGGDEAGDSDPDGTFTYWLGLIFSEEANNHQQARIEAWGEANGLDIEVVQINQNEMVQQVSAAIEAGTMPDALDMGNAQLLQLHAAGQLNDVSDLVTEIGEAHGGWVPLADDQDWPAYGFGVPYGMSGNVLFRRDDVLSEAGFPDPPETWQELSDMAREAQDPPNHYGMGFALSNVGDANMTTTMLHTFGGRVADDAGETCTLDSPETREFLEWISGTWEDGLWPPGTPIWDGGGDNEAYQSGNALFIGNPGSVYLYMRDNDPELLEATQYSAFPGGPVLRAAPANIQYRTIPSSSDFPDLAKDLLRDLADPEFMRGYYENAIYGPVLQDYAEFDLFDAANSPAHAGLLDLALNGTGAAWPDVDNEAFAEYQNNFRTPSMVQRVVVDGLTIDEAVVEAQDACQQIYDRH